MKSLTPNEAIFYIWLIHVTEGFSTKQQSNGSLMHSVLHISRVVIVKCEDKRRSPTMVTVGYKGWWQTPKVHLRLALDPVPQCA